MQGRSSGEHGGNFRIIPIPIRPAAKPNGTLDWGMGMDMKGKQKVAFARVAVCMPWLLVAACSVGSRVEGRMATGQEVEPPMPVPHVVAYEGDAPLPEFAGEPDTGGENETVVLSIDPARIDATAAAVEAVDECKAWQLSEDEAEELFAMSHAVDAGTYLGYGEAPCTITGTVRSGGVDWQFTINGTAKATWKHGSDVRFLGCDERACEGFGA